MGPRHKCSKRNNIKKLYKCEAKNDLYSEESDIEEVEDSQQFFPDSNNKNIAQVSLLAMTGISQPRP